MISNDICNSNLEEPPLTERIQFIHRAFGCFLTAPDHIELISYFTVLEHEKNNYMQFWSVDRRILRLSYCEIFDRGERALFWNSPSLPSFSITNLKSNPKLSCAKNIVPFSFSSSSSFTFPNFRLLQREEGGKGKKRKPFSSSPWQRPHWRIDGSFVRFHSLNKKGWHTAAKQFTVLAKALYLPSL